MTSHTHTHTHHAIYHKYAISSDTFGHHYFISSFAAKTGKALALKKVTYFCDVACGEHPIN